MKKRSKKKADSTRSNSESKAVPKIRGLVVDDLAPDAKPPLTTIERKVLELLFTGLRRKQVAVELKRGKGTIDTHCRKAFSKLGVHSLREAKARLQDIEHEA